MDLNENIFNQFSSLDNTVFVVSQVLIALFFLIELMSIGQLIQNHSTGSTLHIWIELGLKYSIVSLAINCRSQIFEAIIWLVNSFGLKIGDKKMIDYEFVAPDTASYFYQQFLIIFGDGLEVTIKSLEYYLSFLHRLEFNLIKLISPFFISCFTIKSFHNLTKKYIHFSISLCFQYIFLNLILKSLPLIFNILKPELILSDRLKDLLPTYVSLVQGIMIIIIIFSSYFLPRKILM